MSRFRLPRPVIRMLAATLASLALAMSAGSAAGAPAGPGRLNWTPCQDDPLVAPPGSTPTWTGPADCTTLRLPVDWARPWGEQFDLVVARRQATDPARRLGVLLVNPGGPGDSGVDFALRANTYFGADIQARFDIIGFDPRGVARSKPVRCSADLLRRQPAAYPRDQAEFDLIAAYNRELRADCRRNTGPMFDHADTLSVVEDMDALRRALGEPKINYFGHSYGSLLGQQYAERYGHRVRAMVTSANMDHSLDTAEFLSTSATAVEDVFTEFTKWCDRTVTCALHGRDVTALWDGLLARADRGEVTDPATPGRVLSGNDIAFLAAKDYFHGPRWGELAAWVAKLDAPRPPAPAAAAVEPPVLRANPAQAVFCQDWQFRVADHAELTRLTEAELRLAPHMRGALRVHAAVVGCIGWPAKANNPQHRLRLSGPATLLLINARHDPVTPLAFAERVHRQASRNTALLAYDGWGHQVYGRGDCTRAAVDNHLTALKLPHRGAHCAAVEPSGVNPA